MRERPILFADRPVRAILEGRKTVTRRPVKPVPRPEDGARWDEQLRKGQLPHPIPACAYGRVGDRLWVREAWRHNAGDCDGVGCKEHRHMEHRATFQGQDDGPRWRPSIHMPREVCRVAVDVTCVTMERLSNIATHDAMREGVEPREARDPVMEFLRGWDELYAKRPEFRSDADPWVWRVEFKLGALGTLAGVRHS